MKKITLIAMTLIGCFLMTSCNKSPKEAIMKATDAFFAQAENDVKAISSPEEFLNFFYEFDQRKTDFLTDLVTKYDTDDEGNFTALSAEENEALNNYMYERATAYNQVEAEQCGQLLEPLVARLESAVNAVWEKFTNDEDFDDSMITEIEDAMDALEPYEVLDNVPTSLADRYQESFSKISSMFEIGEEE